MNRNIEKFENVTYPYIFRQSVPKGSQGTLKIELTGHGFVKRIIIRFLPGEENSLLVTPYVMLCGDIRQDLLRYPDGMNRHISGDDMTYDIPCYQEIENHAFLCVDYLNNGSSMSKLFVDVVVEYDDYITERNIIG